MKSITKIILLNSFLLLSFNYLHAQGFGRGQGLSAEERADRQTTSMAKQLSLSEAQMAKVKEVNLQFANKMREARSNSNGDRSKMRETMLSLRDEHKAEIKKYLTSEQFENWEKFEAQQQAERRQRFQNQRGGKGRKGTNKKEEGTQGGGNRLF